MACAVSRYSSVNLPNTIMLTWSEIVGEASRPFMGLFGAADIPEYIITFVVLDALLRRNCLGGN